MFGSALLKHNLITETQLSDALAAQEKSGVRIGDHLAASGAIGIMPLYESLAKFYYDLPFVDLLTEPPQLALHADRLEDYLAFNVIPWRMEGTTAILATSEPCENLHTWARAHFADYRLCITSPFDIRRTLQAHFSAELIESSRLKLALMHPRQSARITFTTDQKIGMALTALLAAFCLYVAPFTTIGIAVVLLHLLYAATMLFKWLVFREGTRPSVQSPDYPIPDDKDLPVYSILLPLYREAAILPRLINGLQKLDYPKAKLDIKLLLEEDDEETIAAAKALKPAWNLDIIRVPHSLPRTKPKACNYGLRFVRGEFVTIYDAEDIPDPKQLKKAVAAFRALPKNTACVQARLNYYNAGDNLLTRWFALEYGILFDTMLPGLQVLGIPIPLGGTSNHLHVARLREVGEWDPFNVTEDADLGVRLSARGLQTAIIDSVTWEESPIKLGAWVKQRSRWIKGYMQTWFVHMRDPIGLWRTVGTLPFLGFQFFVGLSWVSFLTAPLVWVVAGLTWYSQAMVDALALPNWFFALTTANLVLHFAIHLFQASYVMRPHPVYQKQPVKMWLAAASFPFYWLLHSVAAYKALWQLITNPHYWEKTMHGHGLEKPVASD